jgi:hypothetical protein
MDFTNILFGAWFVGHGLYIMAKTFVPELRVRGDNFIKTTADPDTRISVNFFGFQKYFGKDKRRWKVVGKMTPMGYFITGLMMVIFGLVFLFWHLIEGTDLQWYAIAAIFGCVLGFIVSMPNLREPLEPSDLPLAKESTRDPMDDPTNGDDFNRMM